MVTKAALVRALRVYVPQQALDVAGTVRCTGVLLGGDQLMSGALKDSNGQRTNVDAGGCYYAD